MPVEGTPQCGPLTPACTTSTQSNNVPVSLADCAGLNLFTPKTAYVNGRPVLSRMKTIVLQQGQCGCINWQFLDPSGVPVDFTSCSSGSSSSSSSGQDACDAGGLVFRLRIKEALNAGDAVTVPGTLQEDKTTVQFCLDSDQTGCPGVFFAEAGIYTCATDGAECLYYTNTFYISVVGGLHTMELYGPPTLAEIRLAIRDSGPAESTLLDNLAFSDEEIALAIIRPVQLWNELPPDLRSHRYNTANFPFRYHWLEAIAGQLFLLAAEYNRRNNLTYSAANVAVNDLDKEPQYEAAGQRRMQAYQQFVRAKKAAINLNQFYGGIS